MTISKFAVAVAKMEGKKVEVNIAQLKEILKVVNKLVGGALYRFIRSI